MSEPLARLAALAGLLPGYRDAFGEPREVPDAVQRALLAAMGLRAQSADEIAASIRALEDAPWRRPLDPVLVVKRAARTRIAVPLTLPADDAGRPVEWRFEPERGKLREGALRFAELPGEAARTIDGRSMERRVFTLPFAVGLGYHRFGISRDGAREAVLPLIVVPPRCHLPRRLREGCAWGFALQLYALRSARDWGIGDFTDLARMTEITARLGGAAIGLNPMHALFPERPGHASPYSPSHRQFLALAYIDPEAVPDFAECAEAQRRVASPAFQETLARLRSTTLVDYPGVAEAKRPILELLYRSFREKHLREGREAASARARAFRDFQRAGGVDLARLATFQALSERFAAAASWRDWPAPFRDPRSAEVAAFAATACERIEFFQYAQWQAHQQLKAAQAKVAEVGLAIGLYHDLALGADGAGAEAWANQGVLARGAALGAPPDVWNQLGQNWGLPPYNPLALREAAYAPFIAVVRANMAQGGALRLDHAIGLERMYWVPAGAAPSAGGYVRYPVDDLFAILALESRRQKCLVIGEDLGTVPETFRARMRAAGMLSYRLLYFEQNAKGEFLKPRRYPALATAAVSTHDLATLPGYWRGRDLEVRAELDRYPSPAAKERAFEQRARDRVALVRALKREGLLAPGLAEDSAAYSDELVRAVYRFLARTPSRLLLVQLEDILGEAEQINLPGTVEEHPNWRRKVALPLEELARDPRLLALAEAIGEERGANKAEGRSP